MYSLVYKYPWLGFTVLTQHWTSHQHSEWTKWNVKGEMLSSESSVQEGQEEFGSSWEKSRRRCTACLLSWAADASEMFWSKFVVVIQKRQKWSLSALREWDQENWVMEEGEREQEMEWKKYKRRERLTKGRHQLWPNDCSKSWTPVTWHYHSLVLQDNTTLSDPQKIWKM